MANFDDFKPNPVIGNSFAVSAGKKLAGFANTLDGNYLFNETVPSQISIFGNETMATQPPSNPSNADTNLIEEVELMLVPTEGDSNQRSYTLVVPDGNYTRVDSTVVSVNNTITGSNGVTYDGEYLYNIPELQIVPNKINTDLIRAGGYTYELYYGGNGPGDRTNGTLLPTGAKQTYDVDPVAGTIVARSGDDTFGSLSGWGDGSTESLRVYLYKGLYLKEYIDENAGAGGNITGVATGVGLDDRVDPNDSQTILFDLNLQENQESGDPFIKAGTALNVSDYKTNGLKIDFDPSYDLITAGPGIEITDVTTGGDVTGVELELDLTQQQQGVSGSPKFIVPSGQNGQIPVAVNNDNGKGVSLGISTSNALIPKIKDTFIDQTISGGSIETATIKQTSGDGFTGYEYEMVKGAGNFNKTNNNNSLPKTLLKIGQEVDLAKSTTGSIGVFEVFADKLTITKDGTVTAEEFIETSSVRYKTDITNMTPNQAVDFVKKLNPVEYTRKSTGNHEYGFLAEEVAEIAPEFVKFNKDGSAEGVHYSRLVTVLTKAFQTLV